MIQETGAFVCCHVHTPIVSCHVHTPIVSCHVHTPIVYRIFYSYLNWFPGFLCSLEWSSSSDCLHSKSTCLTHVVVFVCTSIHRQKVWDKPVCASACLRTWQPLCMLCSQESVACSAHAHNKLRPSAGHLIKGVYVGACIHIYVYTHTYMLNIILWISLTPFGGGHISSALK